MAGTAWRVRAGGGTDLEAVAEIQRQAPEAAQWQVEDYVGLFFRVGEWEGAVRGFLAARELGGGEWELLNLAVAPETRRRGLGRALLAELPEGKVFLEVRESNAAGRRLYESAGFRVVGRRKKYYRAPVEDGIVMELRK